MRFAISATARHPHPDIDRMADDGMLFTDAYCERRCTAGRSSFITGRASTGLSQVGMHGADIGMSADDPTIAELLKRHGYATGQFGKDHLDDETTAACVDVIRRQHHSGTPFFVWMNTTHMHSDVERWD